MDFFALVEIFVGGGDAFGGIGGIANNFEGLPDILDVDIDVRLLHRIRIMIKANKKLKEKLKSLPNPFYKFAIDEILRK